MKKKNKYMSVLVLTATVLFGLGIGAGFYYYDYRKEVAPADAVAQAIKLPIVPLEEAFPHVIAPKSTLFSVLRELEIPPATIQAIVDAAKPIQNLAKLRSGIRFQIFNDNEPERNLVGIQFRFSAIESLDVRKVDGLWTAEMLKEQVGLRTVTFAGKVTSSLWDSAVKVKMDPNLISEVADIFGWEVDFAREVRVNDRWRLTVEQKMVKGEPIGWGAILAAEYENAGTPYHAVLFRPNGEEMGYFTPEGKSLRKMFLKSPIRYGRITSGFNRKRFHPILLTSRAHLGVDYAAPIGTPIRAVGDGVVTFANWAGGGGRVIKLRHNATYQTFYKHLNGFAAGLHPGSRVTQGQTIGYVGNTGLSTGPHVHFEFYQSGQFVDPLGKKFPTAEPIPENYLGQFKDEASTLLAALPVWESVEISARSVMATDSNNEN